jgi:hypothetical protein
MFPAASLAQSRPLVANDHRWVVEQFFFAPVWREKTQYYTGEMKAHYADGKSMGEFGARARRSSLRLIKSGSSEAIYAVEVFEGCRAHDWYAYLNKEGTVWRLAAVRTLALPPFFFLLLDSLDGRKPLPDSLTRMVENMRLTAHSDLELKTFFASQRAMLEAIADGFSRETAHSIAAAPDGLKAPTSALRSLATQLSVLHFRGAWRDSELPGCVFLEIGGMIDNEVGFVRCRSRATPPSMSPKRFILVESVVSDWYLYRTT